MPSPKSNRNGQIDGHRRGRSPDKASSLHSSGAMFAAQICRPRTVPDLVSYRNQAGMSPEAPPRQPPKLLLKVTVLGSLAPVQVLMRPQSTVDELVEAVIRQYVKEGRRPILPTDGAGVFDLHYSQFSLERLDREEKLIALGSRNFFMCPRKAEAAAEGGLTSQPFAASCAKEAGKVRGGDGGGAFAWFKLMHFML